MDTITVDESKLVRVKPLTDDTGKAIASELIKQTVLMEQIAGTTARAALLADWLEVSEAIADGLGAYIMPIGTQFFTDWTDARPGNETVHHAAWNPAHHGKGTLADGEEINVMYAQMDKCMPFDTQFAPYQAFLYAIDGLPAGTYHVTMPSNYGNDVMKGKTYQFTLTQALPAGGQLAGFRNVSNAYSASMLTIYAYASATEATAQETVTASQGSDGADLGTFSIAGVPVPASGTPETTQSVEIGGTTYTYYGLNSIQRVAWGNGRWRHSSIRQWLNGTGTDWWTPATVFDRPPSYVTYEGFLTGLPEDFVAAMKPVAQVTALNYATDGGTAAAPEYDTTYDKVFLPSGKQHFLQCTNDFGGTAGLEGDAWEYWERVAGSSTPLRWSSWGNEATYHPEYVQYDLAAPTTPRGVWMRSAFRFSGGTVAFVTSAGRCYYDAASNGYRVAPACAIG